MNMNKEKINEIYGKIECSLVDLYDNEFKIKKWVYDNFVEITIEHKNDFKISDIQTNILTLIEYLKVNDSFLTTYQTLDKHTNRVMYKIFPLFTYKKIRKFKISIQLIKNNK